MANKAELDTIYVLTKGIILNEETYYELIDERVFEHELTNGLRLFIYPQKWIPKDICNVYYSIWLS